MLLLLKNFLVEEGLMNGDGAVGTVHDNCDKTEDGPYAHGEGGDNKIQYILQLTSLTQIYQSLTLTLTLTSSSLIYLHPASPYQQWRRDAKRSVAVAVCEHPAQVLQGPVHPQEPRNDWTSKTETYDARKTYLEVVVSSCQLVQRPLTSNENL